MEGWIGAFLEAETRDDNENLVNLPFGGLVLGDFRGDSAQALRIAAVAKVMAYMAGFCDRNFSLCFGVLVASHGELWETV